MQGIGTHFILDLYECNGENLNDFLFVKSNMLNACSRAEVSVDKSFFKHIEANRIKDGVVGIISLTESHLSIHTWPKLGFVTVDIFTIGEDVFPEKAKDFIIEKFNPKRTKVNKIIRGELLGTEWRNS